MRLNKFSPSIAGLVLCIAATTACNQAKETATASADTGKIPITTKSAEAKKEFLQGRDFSEKLQAQDSWEHFTKAVSSDPDFATAELALANNAPTAKEFFDHLNKAVALADKASDSEKLLILSAQAGANGDVIKQKEYLDKLITANPNDERAHFTIGAYYFGQQDYVRAIEHYKRPPNWRRIIRLLITFSATPTASKAITRAPSRHSRNTSS